MKILIGKIIKMFENSPMAIEIDGVGIFEINSNDFDYIKLNRHHLIKLRNIIDKELGIE